MTERLYLAAGCETCRFPDKSEFGAYADRSVMISYSLLGEKAEVLAGKSPLEGKAKEFVLEQLRSQPRY